MWTPGFASGSMERCHLKGRLVERFYDTAGLHFYMGSLECRLSGLNETEYGKLHAGIKRGDIVGIEGFPGMNFVSHSFH